MIGFIFLSPHTPCYFQHNASMNRRSTEPLSRRIRVQSRRDDHERSHSRNHFVGRNQRAFSINEPRPMMALSIMMEPIPMRQSSSIIHPCSRHWCPMVTRAPMVSVTYPRHVNDTPILQICTSPIITGLHRPVSLLPNIVLCNASTPNNDSARMDPSTGVNVRMMVFVGLDHIKSPRWTCI